MRKSFLVLLGLGLLVACTSASPAAMPTATPTPLPTATLSPTSTETPTATATATEVPVPAELKNLPPGATAEFNGDGTWKITLKSGDQTEALGIFNPTTCYTITLSDGTSVNVPIAEIGSFKSGQDTPFQIYNITGDKITYAYDAENKVWIRASDVVQLDNRNLEKYIKYWTLAKKHINT